MNTKFTAFAIILSLIFVGVFSPCTKKELEEMEEYTTSDIRSNGKLIAVQFHG